MEKLSKISFMMIHLEEILPPNAHIFAKCLRGIANVHNVCVSEALNPSFESIIGDFVASWKTLEEQFGIGCTLKIHIIGTHLLAKHFIMRVTKLWNRLTIGSMHLKRAMAISSAIERCRHQAQLKNNKK